MATVLFVSEDVRPATGGTAVAVTQMANGLAKQGHSISLLTFPGRSNPQIADSVRLLFCAPDANSLIYSRSGLRQIFSECDRSDVVHVHGLWRQLYRRVAGMAKRRKIPVVISTHGMLEPAALAHHRFRKRLGSWAYHNRFLRSAECIHATSETEANNIRALGLRNPIAMVPWGVDVSCNGNYSRPAERAKRTVLFLSRYHPVKGLDLLVPAWADLSAQHPDWQLVLRGYDDNGYRREVEMMVAQSGAANIEIGPQATGEDKERLFAGADVLVVPSRSENFGYVVAEALARRVPVVTTTGTPWAAVTAQACGWHVPPTREAIAAALRDAMAKSNSELAAMGARGQDLIRREFSIEASVNQMAGVYLWLTGKADRPACVSVI